MASQTVPQVNLSVHPEMEYPLALLLEYWSKTNNPVSEILLMLKIVAKSLIHIKNQQTRIRNQVSALWRHKYKI